ncbi:MAG: hypothetical protein QM758_14805 [Armatimonas sp.]
MDDTSKYIKWVQDVRNCASCNGCSAKAQGYLYNANLPSQSLKMVHKTVVPQAGFLGPRYFEQEKRILVLGKNPGGGDQADRYYALQASIVDEQSLEENTTHIISEVKKRWKPLLNLNIFDSVKAENIAYSNQILCRTNVSARKLEYANDGAFEAIYNSCFENRVLPLIRVLRPHFVIALGEKADNPWPTKLRKLLQATPDCAEIEVYGIHFPHRVNDETAREELRKVFDSIGACANDHTA